MIDQLPLIDTAWGVDRYVASSTRGRLVVPVVYLWNTPGAGLNRDNLTGAVKHGTQVTVTNSREHRGEVWVFVKQDVRHEGKIYSQRGWCKIGLMLNLGERHVDWGDGLSDAAAMPFQVTKGKA